LLGLVGWPVGHSLSPAMHNAAAASLGLDLVYLPLAVHRQELADAIRGLAALGFLGVNVTVPHKEAVMPLLNSVDPAARVIGAVNTIVFSGPAGQRQAAGYNTDWSGFVDDLRAHGLTVDGADCLVLGAGGSARAVAYGLSRAGAQVHVFARRLAQASNVASDLNSIGLAGQVRAYDWRHLTEVTEMPEALDSAILVVNTTPVGMAPDLEASPWPASLPFPTHAFVYDLIYNPARTRLMYQAAESGRPVANGAGMLVRQGAVAFELWTGQRPDVTIMASVLKNSYRQ